LNWLLSHLLCRFLDAGNDERGVVLRRPASKKRQGSREVWRRLCRERDKITTTVEFPSLDEFLAGQITADQQELFDTLVSQHGGADKLSRVDLEKILAIVKTTGALRQATGGEVEKSA
jgi:hypothetical protein